MSHLRLRICLVVMLAAAGAGRAAAQQPRDVDPVDAPVAPKYRVEFILFAHADVDPTEESFVDEHASRAPRTPLLGEPLAGRGADAGAEEPGAGDQSDSADTGAAPDTGPFDFIDPFGQLVRGGDQRAPFQFRILRRDELELGDAYARIERLGAYQVLAHGGWVQDGLDESAAQPMNLANLGVINPQGTLRLYLSRFLHLSVDLKYLPSRNGLATEGPTDPDALSELWLEPEFRIVEQRRVPRSGELHYVDHPLFGLLFMISPMSEEGEDVEDDTADLEPAA
jgi:hypothetical protein